VSALSTGITVAADGTFSNPTLGISGLMAQNGYICFGKNFGGLILQWGHGQGTVAYPISFVTAPFVGFVCTSDGAATTCIGGTMGKASMTVAVNKNGAPISPTYVYWLVIGR
jgi:hypothetical protein